MIKALLGLVIALTATTAQAAIEDDVMELLVSEAAKITLFDKQTGIDAAKENQLPAIIARQLVNGFRLPEHGSSSIRFANSYVNCRDKTPRGPAGPIVGSTTYDCEANFYFQNHAVVRDEVDPNAKSEGGVYFQFEVTRVVHPNAKPVLASSRIGALFRN